ncbi:MAG: hypothetical protein AAF250_04345 [Pseudomonadota bacterium]
MDDTAEAIMERIRSVPMKAEYDRSDIASLIDAENGTDFQVAKFCVGLFLGFSKDKLEVELTDRLGNGGSGIKRFQSDRENYLDVLEELGLIDAMTATVNAKPVWSDILKERLRSGRGSAIQGQQRGRELEDFTEEVIQEVFGSAYEPRCSFQGANGLAKCDFAIPDKMQPFILIEAKGYGATGSKMSDIIGDVDAIIGAKRRRSHSSPRSPIARRLCLAFRAEHLFRARRIVVRTPRKVVDPFASPAAIAFDQTAPGISIHMLL